MKRIVVEEQSIIGVRSKIVSKMALRGSEIGEFYRWLSAFHPDHIRFDVSTTNHHHFSLTTGAHLCLAFVGTAVVS